MTAKRRVLQSGWVALLLLVTGCGSSSTTVTSPAPAERCGITLSTGSTGVPASGGSGTVGVSATRECAWSATVEGSWLSIRSAASGQGEGTVEFSAAANPDPQNRTGAIVVNGSRAQITQAAGECVMTLGAASADLPPAGGTAQVDVRASSALCQWSASSDVPWITIASGSPGRGNGTVTLAVAATTGPPRTGSVIIAGLQFAVNQTQGCTYALDRSSQTVSQSGGSGALTITTGAACPWTAASNVNWLSVTPASGAGPGAVTFTVAATDGPQRTGTAVIAGQLFTVTQSPGCTFDVQPVSHSIGAAGGTGTVSVATSAGCGWTSSSNVPWITLQGATTGNGAGAVTFSVAATTGPARTGTLTVAGRQVTVTQTQGCTYAISPQNQNVPATGGSGRVSVTAGAGCAWTATSAVPWITVSAGATGSGNGDVQFTVAATSGPARSGTLTIAGQTFTVTQGQGCTTTLSPSRVDVDNAGGARSFDVQTAAGCAWTATTSASWITITSGASGSGNGTVRFTVAANAGPGRTGTITAGGQTFTVSQGTGCSVTLSAERQDMPASGGSGTVNVIAADGCTWEVSRNTPGDTWLTITSASSGSGNGSVTFTVADNTGAARSTSLTIGGRTFTVNQAGAPCTYTINPTEASVASGPASVDVDVTTTGGGCAWEAKSHAPWIQVAMGATGNNNGRVRLAVEANSGAQRTGTVTIAGQTFTLTQGDGCTFGVAPDTIAGVASSGGTARVDVTASSTCGWTSASNADWITITQPGSGTGNGSVELAVAPNSSTEPRTGTVTIATRTVTITQQASAPAPPCVVTLTPSSATVPLTGGPGSFAVAAPEGCTWTANPSDNWITITAGPSGTGNGTVEFSVAPATAPRTGTIVVNGQTFTINQQ